MKKLIIPLLLMVLMVSIAFAGGTKKTLSINSGYHSASRPFTVSSGNIDTLIYNVEPGLATLTFWLYSPDSVVMDYVTIQRVFTIKGGTTVNPAVATIDTLALFTALSNVGAAQAATVVMQAVTLSPVPDQIWFIMDRGTAGTGVTSTTAYAGVNKTYYKVP
jgi:hypothetical protein